MAQKLTINSSSFKLFYENTLMHGINYSINGGIIKIDRFLWRFLILFEIIGSAYTIYSVHKDFTSESLQVILEDALHPLYETRFPQVVIINQSRINWKKFLVFKENFFKDKNLTSPSKNILENFLIEFENFKYGEFDRFSKYQGQNLRQFDSMLNITNFLETVSLDCEDLFERCTWNEKERECCKLFSKQRTELGYGFIFNSERRINEENYNNNAKHYDSYEEYPWLAKYSGPNSGLTVTFKFDPNIKRPSNYKRDGIWIDIERHRNWPSYGLFLPKNTYNRFIMEPSLFVADIETQSLDIDIRRFIFQKEKVSSEYFKSPGLPYTYINCMSECKRQYISKFCNCTTEYLFPTDPKGKLLNCKVSDYLCLANFYEQLRITKLPEEDKYVNNHGDGITCKCYYSEDILRINMKTRTEEVISVKDKLKVEIYFKRGCIFKYSIYLKFNWLKFVVYSGGLITSSLGWTLVNFLEMFYFTLMNIIK